MRIFLFFFLLIPLCLNAQTDSILTILQSRINHSGKHKVHSILFYLEKTKGDFIFHEGLGLTKKKGEIASKDAQFKIASITKPFVAIIVLQLAEERKLQLEDKIFEYLKAVDFLNFENFHFYEKESYVKDITIEHLLSHRSGLADIFNDKGFRFYSGVFLNKKKQYSPEAIVEKYFKYGLNRKAHFMPGDDFYYSDMNYVLLGLLIQQIERKSLAEVIKTRILGPLNMKDTYLEFYEPTNGNRQKVHQYIKKMDMTKVNTSFDWAGGGLVSTNVDLATFIKAFFNGQLINKASLQKMTSMKFTQEHHNRYGLGLYESKYNGDIYYGHYGFYGSYLGYCPEKEIVIAYNISQSNTDFYVSGLVNDILIFFEGGDNEKVN